MTPIQQYTQLELNLASLIGPIKFSATINLKLERISYLLELLGNPHRAFASIHVGGTSGKGSTAALTAHLLIQSGYKTGLHTSPHLQILNERHQIDGIVAPTSLLLTLLDEMWPAILEVERALPFGKPSYFEVQFALSCLYFAREQVDVAVVEVGLGGRLDGTNVLQSQVAIITNIGLDHTAILGETIEEITTEKAGIIKPNQIVITAVSQPSAQAIIVERCVDVGAMVTFLDDADGNWACAYAAVKAFDSVERNYKNQQIKRIRLPGRMEQIQSRPTVILDGAHNPDKMRYSVAQLDRLLGQSERNNLILIVAMKDGKDVRETLKHAIKRAQVVIVTAFSPTGLWTAVPTGTLADTVRDLAPDVACFIEPTPHSALQYALSITEQDSVVWVTGSLYLIGEIRQRWYSNKQLIEVAEMGLFYTLKPAMSQ